MNKAVCQRCIGERRLYEWGLVDHNRWEEDRAVLCPDQPSGPSAVDEDPPLWCYYRLEQLVLCQERTAPC
jgi:hypothetical protein